MRAGALAVCIVLVWAATAAAQGYRPPGSLSVSDPSPDAGAVLIVTVLRCGPEGTLVDVTIDGVVVATATIGADGDFEIVVEVPEEAAGEVPVEANCPDGVLGSIIDVQIPDLPFQTGGGGGASLPATGASTTSAGLRIGAMLIGLGVALTTIAMTGRARGLAGASTCEADGARPLRHPAHGRTRSSGRAAPTASPPAGVTAAGRSRSAARIPVAPASPAHARPAGLPTRVAARRR